MRREESAVQKEEIQVAEYIEELSTMNKDIEFKISD